MLNRPAIERTLAALEKSNLDVTVLATARAALQQQLAQLEQPVSSKRKLSGERRQVTVMFADISGFTAMSEKLDPEEVRHTINNCFDRLGAVVARYGGYIDKFIGDEIMALFGAPIAHENDPERALRAALDMMTALEEFNAIHAHRLPKPLALHFGLNTGLVIAGGIGTSQRQDYSVMGDTVNLAARLEDLSETGEILVGPNTYRLTAPLFEFEPLKPVKLKGKAQPVQVYRLLRAKSVIGGQIRGIEGLSSPMVGRTEEFTTLVKSLTELQQGQGCVVSITGEAGLGKSRLIAELRDYCERHHHIVHWAKGQAISYAENASYLITRDILRNMLNIPAGASAAEANRRLQDELMELLPDQLMTVQPYLAYLLELPLNAEASQHLKYLDPQVLQRRIVKAMQIYIASLTKQLPVVMIWDDLHWADPSSLDLLGVLLPQTEHLALMQVLIFRPRHNQTLSAFQEKINQAQITLKLQPLSPEESHQLIINLLGNDGLPADTRQLIVRKAEGNPFFIEEVIRSLIDGGTVTRMEHGAGWRLTGDINEITIPDTLQGVVMARIDSLDPETKRILQIAAVVGRSFDHEVLARLLDKQ